MVRALGPSYTGSARLEARTQHTRADVSYVNGGAESLQGSRTIVAAGRALGVNGTLRLERLGSAGLRTFATLRGQVVSLGMDATPRTVPTDGGRPLDIEHLAGASASASGASVGVGARWAGGSGAGFEGGWSVGQTRWEASGAATTPVLGYVVGSLLPISHRLSGTLGARALAQRGYVSGAAPLARGLRIEGLFSATTGRLYFDLDGHAALVHSLSDADVSAEQSVRFTALRLSLAPSFRLGSGVVRYSWDQSVPIIDLQASQAPTGDRLRVRGGAAHTLSYHYSF